MKPHFVFAVCSFVAAPGLVRAQFSAPPLDHFTCYFTQGPPLPGSLYVLDEFDTAPPNSSLSTIPLETVTDLTPFRFCNPTNKTVFPGGVTNTTTQTNPDAHLVMYRITNQPDIPRAVQFQNQFTPAGGSVLITGPAEYLAVPSGKTLFSLNNSVPGAPQPPDVSTVEGKLDHFKCYAVTAAPSVNVTVTLVDEFSTLNPNGAAGVFATVLRPYLFCNPAIKVVPTGATTTAPNPLIGVTMPVTITPTVNPVSTTVNLPASHLTCYLIAVRQPIPPLTVAYDNQFVPLGTLPILPADLETLCVPTAKGNFAPILALQIP